MENGIVKRQSNEIVSFNFFNKDQFDTMQRVCKLFASSELVPEMYREGEKTSLTTAMANCMIALEVAQRIGASPLMVMQNMYIVHGRPSWSSKFLIATVNTCGRFNPLKYKFTNLGRLGKIEYTDYVWNSQIRRKEAKVITFDGTNIDNIQCVAWTTAKGSDDVLESTAIDIKMAVQEGWYTKAGSKWQTMERQMLTYRAASFWTNAYAPELSMGMMTAEEVYDIVDVEYEDMTVKVEKEKAEQANKEVVDMDKAMEEEKPTEDAKEEKKEAPKEAKKAEPKEDKKEEPKEEPKKVKKIDFENEAPSWMR